MKIKGFLGRICLVFVAIFDVLFAPISTNAITEKMERRYSNYNIYFYDPCSRKRGGAIGSMGSGSEQEVFVNGSDNASTIMSNLVNAGYTKEAAAAIMGNLQAEAGFNPRKFEGGALAGEDFRAWNDGKTFSGGFGIAQWTSAGRVQRLQEYADSHNLPVISLQAQVGYLIQELSGYRSGPGDLNNVSMEEAVFTVARYFEAPGAMIWTDHDGKHYNDRIPGSFSELSSSETAGAYGVWKTRNGFAAALLGIEPTDLPEEIIMDGTDTYAEECGVDETGGQTDGEIGAIDINGIKSFLQCDSQWANLKYSSEGINSGSSKTICSSGCGPTSFASILATMGFDVNPADVADVAGKLGMYEYDVGSKHEITRKLADHYGLAYQDVNPKSVDQINSLLNSGYKVHIVGKGSMPYSSGGHYVAIMGVDSNGNWIVSDSGHGQKNAVATYSPNQIVSGATYAGAVKK